MGTGIALGSLCPRFKFLTGGFCLTKGPELCHEGRLLDFDFINQVKSQRGIYIEDNLNIFYSPSVTTA
jgi:hypothetical protein